MTSRIEQVLASCLHAKLANHLERQKEYEKLLCEDVSLSNFCDYFDRAVEHGLEQLMVRCFKEYLAQYDCHSYHQKLLNLPLKTVMIIDAHIEGGSDKYLNFVLDWIKRDPDGRSAAKPKLLKQFYHRWGKVLLDYYAEHDELRKEYASDDEDAQGKAIFDAAKTLVDLLKRQPEKVRIEPYGVFEDDSSLITNQKLVCLGGNRRKSALLRTISVYNQETGKWSILNENKTPLRYIEGAVIGSSIYVCGFPGKKSQVINMKVLNTQNMTWTNLKELPCRSRKGFAVASVGGKVYFAGGGAPPLSDCYCYSPTTQSWTNIAPMPTKRAFFELVELDGYLYAVGGGTRALERYDPAANQWDTLAFSHNEMMSPGAVAHRGEIFVGCSSKKFEVYAPVSNSWKTLELFKKAKSPIRFASVNGKLLAVCGVTTSAGFTHSLWEYRFFKDMENAGKWEKLPDTEIGRKGTCAFVVQN